jgi:hypothetical protein
MGPASTGGAKAMVGRATARAPSEARRASSDDVRPPGRVRSTTFPCKDMGLARTRGLADLTEDVAPAGGEQAIGQTLSQRLRLPGVPRDRSRR